LRLFGHPGGLGNAAHEYHHCPWEAPGQASGVPVNLDIANVKEDVIQGSRE
jgi:hypothetical protein